MKEKQKVIFLTWASWVGKTTITKELKKIYDKLENVIFSSFDNEEKIPEEKEVIGKWWSWEKWQKESCIKYIKERVQENKQAVLLVLDMQTNLDFIDW
jgi:adenylate kinase